MYPLKWTYTRARQRIQELPNWATPAEAFVLTLFFVEKIIRRTLVQIVIRKGKTPAKAFKTVRRLLGIVKVKEAWSNYDQGGRALQAVIGAAHWQRIEKAAKLRNALVHGSGHQAQKVYGRELLHLRNTLDHIRNTFSNEYGYSGWKGMKDNAGNLL